MRVLILAPYPSGQAPSQRFRFEQYLDYLAAQGVGYDMQTFWDERAWSILYKHGHGFQKAMGFLRGWLRRFTMLFRLHRYDFVFIHREAAPLGPPVIEWMIAKLFRKKIIYDYDDAIWLPNVSAQNSVAAALKWHGKVSSICKWAWKISCGNAFLASYAKRFNPNAVIVPTTVDTDYHKPTQRNENQKVLIGWTGSVTTNAYLKDLEKILVTLREQVDFDFRVISNKEPELQVPYKFVKWSPETEVEELAKLDIGVMPLPDNEWSKGKCGFKLIQYHALGIPAVASPVGVNAEVVLHNQTGFLAANNEEWIYALKKLVNDKTLRKAFGQNGRRHIESHYSVRAMRERYLDLFR